MQMKQNAARQRAGELNRRAPAHSSLPTRAAPRSPRQAVLCGVTSGCTSARTAASPGRAAPRALCAGSLPGEISLFNGNPLGRSGACNISRVTHTQKTKFAVEGLSDEGFLLIKGSLRGAEEKTRDGGPQPRSPAAHFSEICFLSRSRPLPPPAAPLRLAALMS